MLKVEFDVWAIN